jgi:hypothetical protein
VRAGWLRSGSSLAALLIFVAGLCLVPITESDLFFRIEVGQQILASRQIPYRNLFSFTYPHHPDLDLSWLFEVGAAALFGVAGFAGVVLAKTAVVLAVFAGGFAICRRRGAGPVLSALVLAAAALVMRERLVERPHLASFAGEMAALALLERIGRGREAATLLAAAALAALWANLHAGVFLAAAIFALHAAGSLAAGRRQAARQALILAAVACGAMLASPVGVGIFRYLALHLELPRLHPVDEFRAATLQSDPGLALYGAALLVVAGLAARRARRDLLPDLLPVLALGILAWRSVRFGADFALLAAPFLAGQLPRLRPQPSAFAAGPVPAVGAIALLLGLTIGPRAAAVRQGLPWIDVGLDPTPLPLHAIQFVNTHGLRQRMYNDFEIGSYLAFEGYPRYRVFIDPRLPAYPAEFHRLMGRSDLDRKAWDRAMERYGVESALLAYAGLNRRVSWWDPERWALVYRERDARVFVRRVPRWQALIREREIPATFHFTLEEGNRTLPLFDRPAASPVADCEWQRRLGDLVFELDDGNPARALPLYRRAAAGPAGCLEPRSEADLHAWLGASDLLAGQPEQALHFLDRALALEPGDLKTRTNRALALEKLGRKPDAAAEWVRVAALAAGTPLATRAQERARQLRNISK